jgi:tetratricopeptide (TPR) repeat protein
VDDAGRVEALLRSARLSDGAIGDRQRALHYVAQAVALSARNAELAESVEATVRGMDEARPDLGPYAARSALVDVYRRLAEDAGEMQPEVSGSLLLRAARVLAEDLEDPQSAFEVLAHAASVAPSDIRILDELEDFAEKTGRLEALDELLGRLVDEALDSRTAAELLKRRGRVLEVELERPSEAAEVFNQLGVVSPHDPEVPRRLRACLRAASRHQDLLMVMDRELERAREPERQIAILKEIATTWENDLKNRWEALDAWKRVMAMSPGDEDATTAVKRLGHSTRKLSADELADIDGEEQEDFGVRSAPRAEPAGGVVHTIDEQEDDDDDSIKIPDLPLRDPQAPLPRAGSIEGSGEFTDPGLANPDEEEDELATSGTAGRKFARHGFGLDDVTDAGEESSAAFSSAGSDAEQERAVRREVTADEELAAEPEEDETQPPQRMIYGSMIGSPVIKEAEPADEDDVEAAEPSGLSELDAEPEPDRAAIVGRASQTAQLDLGDEEQEPPEQQTQPLDAGMLARAEGGEEGVEEIDEEIEEIAEDLLLESAEASLDADELEELVGESEAPRPMPAPPARLSGPPPPPPARPSQAPGPRSVPPPPPVPRRR